MNFKKLFRDVAVLVAFCGAFYWLITFVNRFDGNGESDGSDFSTARKQADRSYFQQSDYARAAVEYAKLTEQDPFNGHAWVMLASSHYERRNSALRRLAQLTDDDEVAAPEEIESALAEVEQFSKLAFDAYAQAKRFARNRDSASFWMGVIDAGRGAIEFRRGNRAQADKFYQQALDSLEEFVERGGRTRNGLDKFKELGTGGESQAAAGVTPTEEMRLHFEPRFWEIVKRENRAYGRR